MSPERKQMIDDRIHSLMYQSMNQQMKQGTSNTEMQAGIKKTPQPMRKIMQQAHPVLSKYEQEMSAHYHQSGTPAAEDLALTGSP